MKNGVKLFLVLTTLTATIVLPGCNGCQDLEGISIGQDMVHYYRFGTSEDACYENIYSENIPVRAERYYAVGKIEEYHKDGDPNTVQFIAAEINRLPVMKAGFYLFMNNSNSHYSHVLEKIYVPGTLIESMNIYFTSDSRDLAIYYCGDSAQVVNAIASGQGDCSSVLYVPAEMYSDFANCITKESEGFELHKANVAYMLNTEDMPDYYTTEYYYVDYVEYGESILSIPPDPVRKGYTFGGWYKEPECEREWSSTYAVPEPEDGEDFKELRLYAKWERN